MAAAALIFTALGTAVQFIGANQQGKAAQAAANYNADIADQNAVLTREQTIEQERRARVESRKQLGLMRANYAASGVDIDGSALDVLEESAATAELDALTIRHGGELQEQAYRSEAAFQRFSGKQARKASRYGASGVLLQGSAQTANYGKDIKWGSSKKKEDE
jgi:hypothetical protein